MRFRCTSSSNPHGAGAVEFPHRDSDFGASGETKARKDLLEIDLMANKGKEEITKADEKCDSETDALTHIPGPLGQPTPIGTKSSRGEGFEGKIERCCRR